MKATEIQQRLQSRACTTSILCLLLTAKALEIGNLSRLTDYMRNVDSLLQNYDKYLGTLAIEESAGESVVGSGTKEPMAHETPSGTLNTM